MARFDLTPAEEMADEARALRQERDELKAERDSLKRQIETFEEINADLVRRNNEHWEVRKALSADLAACRTRLVALADAYEYTEKATGFGGRYRAYEDARDWLAAHPAKGGQDASV